MRCREKKRVIITLTYIIFIEYHTGPVSTRKKQLSVQHAGIAGARTPVQNGSLKTLPPVLFWC